MYARSSYVLAVLLAASTAVRAELRPPQPAPHISGAPDAAEESRRPSEPFTPEFRICMRSAGSDIRAGRADDATAVLACLADEQKRQDERLSVASQKLAKMLPAERRIFLEIANGDWRRFRASECNLIADDNGPGPSKLENADCKLRMTIRRMTDMDNSANVLIRREAMQREPSARPADAETQRK